MKLNCDMGEGVGEDTALMPLIDIANIACGQHAGDAATMRTTIGLAISNNVAIAAHPGYPDREGFGRRELSMSADELVASLHRQLGLLHRLCDEQGAAMRYVKPHGALYNGMMKDPALFGSLLDAVAGFNASLPLIVQAANLNQNQQLRTVAAQRGVSLLFEAFADRAYRADGSLESRAVPGAVYDDPDMILAQAQQLLSAGRVTTLTGAGLEVAADTLCLHGDNPATLAALRKLRLEL